MNSINEPKKSPCYKDILVNLEVSKILIKVPYYHVKFKEKHDKDVT